MKKQSAIITVFLILNFCILCVQSNSAEYSGILEEIADRLRKGENEAVVDLSDIPINSIIVNGTNYINEIISYTSDPSTRTADFFCHLLELIDEKDDSIVNNTSVVKCFIDLLDEPRVTIRDRVSCALLKSPKENLTDLDASHLLNDPELFFCPGKIYLSAIVGDEELIPKIKELRDKIIIDHGVLHTAAYESALVKLGDEQEINNTLKRINSDSRSDQARAFEIAAFAQNKKLLKAITDRVLNDEYKDQEMKYSVRSALSSMMDGKKLINLRSVKRFDKNKSDSELIDWIEKQ